MLGSRIGLELGLGLELGSGLGLGLGLGLRCLCMAFFELIRPYRGAGVGAEV